MSKLVKPEISPDFTMEDLYKLRAYNSQRWADDPEGRRKDLKENSAEMQAEIDKVKQARKLAAVN